jgi:hypothetical protein
MRTLAIGLAVLSLGGVAAAQPAKQLNIAIYAPNAPFASGNDRFTFVQRLAQQITSAAGVPAQGKAYAAAGAFEAAIKAKQVDFAVIDGVYLAEKGVSYPVLAISTTGGETAPRWGLFSATAATITELQGKKLSLVTAGPRDEDFVGNALLDGEAQVKKFFTGGVVKAPDLASAVAAVSFKKADAVFAPEAESKGMKNLYPADRVPNPAFCQVASGLGADVVSKVRQAVLSHGAAAALDGWKSGDAGPYRSLAAKLGVKSKRPFMAEPEVVHLEGDYLVPPVIEPAVPSLKDQYWNP